MNRLLRTGRSPAKSSPLILVFILVVIAMRVESYMSLATMVGPPTHTVTISGCNMDSFDQRMSPSSSYCCWMVLLWCYLKLITYHDRRKRKKHRSELDVLWDLEGDSSFQSIHPSSIPACYCSGSCWSLSQFSLSERQEYTLDMLPVHCRANLILYTQMMKGYVNWGYHITSSLSCLLLLLLFLNQECLL